MRKLIFFGFVAAALLLPQPPLARAGGIPVFDGVGLAQSITGYVQTLMDYAEQLNQLNVMDSQYVTQLQQYQRELEEYQHYLNQIQRMGAVLNDADWQKVLQQTITYYGNSPWASIPNVNVTTSAGAANIKTVVESAYEVPENVADTVTQWQTRIPGYEMTAREQQEHSRNYAQMQKFMDRQMAVAKNQADINDRAPMIDDFKTSVYALGDDSDLKTQHLIAQQMNFLLQQQEILSSQLNQLISSQETMSEFSASMDAEAKRLANEQQEKHKNNYLPTSLGSNQWKNL
jgi:hypothetical protein